MAMNAGAQPGAAIASVCPLCRRANGCAMAASDGGGDAASPCWCVAAAIDPATLARASAHDGGRSCVCAACAAATP
jgi:hypothetical protein